MSSTSVSANALYLYLYVTDFSLRDMSEIAMYLKFTSRCTITNVLLKNYDLEVDIVLNSNHNNPMVDLAFLLRVSWVE